MRTRSRAFTYASPKAPATVLVEILAHPLLGHHQGPQTIGVGPGAAQVLRLHRLHRVDVEETAHPDAVGRQQIVQRRSKVAPKPVAQRNHEALLRVGEHPFGEDAAERGFEEALQAPTGHLGARREAQTLLDDPMVAKRRSYL